MSKPIRKFRVISLLILKCQKVLRILNIGITTASNLTRLQAISLDKSRSDLLFIRAMGQSHYEHLFMLLDESQSQLRQDLMVLAHTNYKQGGYFVEFGATNGILLSNSYLLEQKYGWNGILAEPGRIWESELRRNRPNARISTQCVWNLSNQILTFNENQDLELSTVSFFQKKKSNGKGYRTTNSFIVKTVSLMDLLIENNAPKYIDYLSIDTEGSELTILQSFDFSKFSFGCITVEHNYGGDRDLIYALLSSAGYTRRFEDISKWDDWYFNQTPFVETQTL
jgi:FkbM family methyltransferase